MIYPQTVFFLSFLPRLFCRRNISKIPECFGSYNSAVWICTFLPSGDLLDCVSFRLWEVLMDLVSEDAEMKDFKKRWRPDVDYNSVEATAWKCSNCLL